MDIVDRVRDLQDRVSKQAPHAQTEEATKLALINPFIREVLGYNTADLSEVVPEYIADVGAKKGEKVDYAIMRDGQPLILIEAKKASTSLQEQEPTQLYRYFTATPSARFGIYTNGVRYLFYSDLDNPNLMDRLPFLVLDLLAPDPRVVEEVAKFVKSEFDPGRIRESANTLKYTRALKEVLQSELSSPSQEFVRLLMSRVFTGLKTATRLSEFTQMTKAAANELIRDELRGTLNSALARDEARSNTQDEAQPDSSDDKDDSGIVTTETELSAYYAVKSILNGVVDVKRVSFRDGKSYSSVLLDNSNRKPICRFRFDGKQKYLGLFDEAKAETRLAVDDVDDIYQHVRAIQTTAKRYDES